VLLFCSRAATLNLGVNGAPDINGRDGAMGATGPTGALGGDTGAHILHKLKQVDGAGPGLNADQLCGFDASAYVRGGGTKVLPIGFAQMTYTAR
jgi:hypothetical protein